MIRVFNKGVRARFLQLQGRNFGFQPVSKITSDVRSTLSPHQLNREKDIIPRGKYANQIPDYEVTFDEIAIQAKQIEAHDVFKEHPIETDVRRARLRSDVYQKLQDNQIIMTNLPFVDHPLQTVSAVEKFLKEKVHRDLTINKVDFIKAVSTLGENTRIAYIIVTLGSKRQAYMAKTQLRKEWIEDSLLKIKVTDDLKREHFNNRTIVVREIPRYLRIEHVLGIFGSKHGAVVNVELPTEFRDIKETILEQNNRVGTKADDNKIASIRAAELQIKQSLAVDQEYQAFLQQNLDEETASSVIGSLRSDPNLQAPEALDQERVSSLITMVTHLQAEGQHVLQNKLNLLNLKSKHSVIDNQRTETNEQVAADFVMENSDKIKSVLTYLEKTKSESEVVASSEDFLQRLLNLTKGELMYAYDELIKELEYREMIVAERLKDSVEHFKDNERILMEGKDWSKEIDDVPDPYVENGLKIEEVISVNQQVVDIYQVKKMPTEEKLYRILHKELNPFLEGNFNVSAIGVADEDLASEYKYSTLPYLLQNKTRMREDTQNTEFIPEFQEQFDSMLKRLRTDFEIPFDEIYHREKQVIADVIAAQKLLALKQSKLKDPMSHKILDQKLLTVEQRANIQQLVDSQKPRFELSLEREQERALASQIEKLDKTLGLAGKYNFAENDEQKWRAMVDAGELTESDLNKLILIRNENATQNLGYCFITFSHSDEARLMLMLNKKPFFMEDKQIEFDLKSLIDHGDLDMHYTIQRSKNDSMLIEEIEALREAKKNLREFEKSMDKVLPKNKKLKMFHERTKDLLEDHEFENRNQKIAGDRDEMDQLKLDRKIRELEKKFPNVNFTQLYATEQAEAAKQALHKKAYASYKAFQFLKHGVKTYKDVEEDKVTKISKAKQRLIDNDPYNFPLMDQTVHRILTKDVIAPTAIDKGDRIDKPGRRQGITTQEYLESYFGKDMLRQPRQKVHDDSMFIFQKTLKEKYPMEQFLRLPEQERKMKIIEDLGMDFDYKKFPLLKFKNNKIQHVIDENNDNFQDQIMGDQKFNLVHPTDPSRNLVEDLIKATEEELKKTEESDKGAELYPANFDKIRQELKKEYNLPNRFNFGSQKQDRMWEHFNKGTLRGKEILNEEDEKATDEKAAAKFETDYDKAQAQEEHQEMGFGEQELDEAQSQLNKEFFYRYKQKPESVDKSINEKVNAQFEKEYYKKSIQERVQSQPEEMDVFNDILKDEALIKQAGNKYGGDNFKRHRIGMDRVEDRFTKHKRGKGLKEFFAKDDQSQIPNSEQEDDDMDVYEHYRRQVDNLPKSKQDEERINKFKINQQALQPDMPRLNDYFDSQSKGLHPFEKIANNFDDSEVRTAYDDEFEKEEEAALYKRELMGRLMGQKLTPRQFEVLSGQFRSVDAKLDRVQDAGRQKFLDQRDQIRLVEEKLEGIRRKQVQLGNWTEENSKQELQEVINQLVAETPGPNQQARIDRETILLYESLRQLDNPESLFEKEFHFDENVGVSLADHMTKLRKQYPGATVQQRRDRDGFAIIKVSFKPEYKYDLEHLTHFNLEQEKSKFLESMEELLKKITKGVPLEDLVDQEQIANSIQSLAENQQMVKDVSAYAKLKLNQLVKERVTGVYKDDNAGFVEEVFSLLNDEKVLTKSKTAKQKQLLNFDESEGDQKSQVDMIFEDRDRFRLDMADQIRRRMLKQETFTKRKESDFIRPKVNEKEAFEDQSLLNDMNIDYLEDKSNEMEAKDIKDEDFDKDAYYKLKDELKMRKETKERLLSQGIPQFKAYMRF